MSRLSFTIAGLLVLVVTTAGAAAAQSCPDPSSMTRGLSEPLADVRYLADDALEGREVGSPGEHCAGDYIAGRFRALGLRPGGPDESYFQSFQVRTGTALGTANGLEISGNAYTLGKDWVPFGFSAAGEARGALVYGGPGVSAPGAPEDSYAHLDLTGRITVVEWGDADPVHGPAIGSDPHFKATVAAGRDAAGMLILLPDGGALPELAEETRAALRIPVAAVTGDAADRVRSAAQAGETVALRTDVRPEMSDARNVVALLPGSDPALAREYVVVGAHYDHLGYGGEGSLDPDHHEIHNGADDNASGTAGVLDIAERLSRAPRPQRSVIFIAFTGEERGLWGSAHWVAEPTVALDRVVAMLNLDMVGRMKNDEVTVFGIATADEWKDVVEGVNGTLAAPLKLGLSPDGYGPSDHSSFYGEGIPVLHFFTNTHEDYHRPSDDWQKIDGPGIDRVAALASGIARRVATGRGPDAVALTPEVAEPPAPPTSSDEPSASSGYGPYLGTIPDMTPRDFGLRLTGVREGSPAEKAGLQGGDVVVEFDGREITDIYAYTYALRDRSPGDEVTIVVERDGERLTFKAVLEVRR